MKDNIYAILKELGIKYDKVQHEPTTSCEHSKQIRTNLGLKGVGSKNIIFHCKGRFYIVVTLGDKKIKARLFKKEFGSKDIRFATSEEIKEQIDGTIGCIPSFGYLNEKIPIYVDAEIFENDYFMFNPDDPTITIRLKTDDLKKVYENLKNPIKFFKMTENGLLILECF